jgi:hypothetical protein
VGGAVRRLRGADRAPGVRVGREGGAGRGRAGAGRARGGGKGTLHDPVGDLDRRAERRARARRGGRGARRSERVRRRLGPRRGGPADRRVGARRGRVRLSEGAHVPARACLRGGLRPCAGAGGRRAGPRSA